MTIYKVKHGDYGSYEDSYSVYFDSMEKAKRYWEWLKEAMGETE